MLRLNIKFLHTTAIIASASSTYYNKVCILVPNCGQNLNLEFLFVDTISTHTLYLASLFCLLWVIIVSLNSSHQLLTQERFETVVPSVSIKKQIKLKKKNSNKNKIKHADWWNIIHQQSLTKLLSFPENHFIDEKNKTPFERT